MKERSALDWNIPHQQNEYFGDQLCTSQRPEKKLENQSHSSLKKIKKVKRSSFPTFYYKQTYYNSQWGKLTPALGIIDVDSPSWK